MDPEYIDLEFDPAPGVPDDLALEAKLHGERLTEARLSVGWAATCATRVARTRFVAIAQSAPLPDGSPGVRFLAAPLAPLLARFAAGGEEAFARWLVDSERDAGPSRWLLVSVPEKLTPTSAADITIETFDVLAPCEACGGFSLCLARCTRPRTVDRLSMGSALGRSVYRETPRPTAGRAEPCFDDCRGGR